MDRTSKGLEENELAISPRGKNLKRRVCVFRWRVGRCRGAGSRGNDIDADRRSIARQRNSVAVDKYETLHDLGGMQRATLARKNSSNDRTILRYSKTTLFATALNIIQRRIGCLEVRLSPIYIRVYR